ncbi:MAG: hypothetical protein H7A23_24505 [Leptospiraceae bacterium]|nr:hypothetical protein [Leptospiraceae bacterium]MCP5497727.1 hypothetical protein [Leptospiraceae bacterium]
MNIKKELIWTLLLFSGYLTIGKKLGIHNKTKNGVVIEIKQIEKKKRESEKKLRERIGKELKTALSQIEVNRYYKELVEHKVANIIKVPIVFLGKNAYL